MKSKIIKCLLLGAIFIFVVIVCIYRVTFIQKNEKKYNSIPTKSSFVASVNGEKILKKEIDVVYKQFKNSGIQYDEILENSIDEILVIQQAKKFSISRITESEVQEQLKEYKDHYPDLYKEAVNTYGKDDLYKGMQSRMTYEKVKKYVFSNILQNKVTDDNVKRYIAKHSLSKLLEKYSIKQIKQSLNSEIVESLFDDWVDSLRKEAQIVYY